MDDQIAKVIYFGLRQHGLTEHTCAFGNLPEEYKTQLQSIADSIPIKDPYEKLEQFAARSRDIGHYVVAPLVASFLQCEAAGDGQ